MHSFLHNALVKYFPKSKKQNEYQKKKIKEGRTVIQMLIWRKCVIYLNKVARAEVE